ncbi:hypothetical protein QR680_002575 [Steinernema hermaphroditum]|uniref:Uncharacterized protein n=1 Tax=Steinernema hermaphroditum TaxID=289476 RepID=A0AA39H5W5_9BILA|nr:hypothetical protein QR680_002575 [Steinernema hermaphroditum]
MMDDDDIFASSSVILDDDLEALLAPSEPECAINIQDIPTITSFSAEQSIQNFSFAPEYDGTPPVKMPCGAYWDYEEHATDIERPESPVPPPGSATPVCLTPNPEDVAYLESDEYARFRKQMEDWNEVMGEWKKVQKEQMKLNKQTDVRQFMASKGMMWVPKDNLVEEIEGPTCCEDCEQEKEEQRLREREEKRKRRAIRAQLPKEQRGEVESESSTEEEDSDDDEGPEEAETMLRELDRWDAMLRAASPEPEKQSLPLKDAENVLVSEGVMQRLKDELRQVLLEYGFQDDVDACSYRIFHYKKGVDMRVREFQKKVVKEMMRRVPERVSHIMIRRSAEVLEEFVQEQLKPQPAAEAVPKPAPEKPTQCITQ